MHVAPLRALRACAMLLSALLALTAGAVVLSSPTQAATTYTSCVNAAHRGFYKGKWTENSLNAFRAAIDAHASYLEMDVQITKDGWFVLMHDETIDRTTNGSGRIINKTWAQLQKLRLNDGQRIPSLKSVLDTAAPSSANVLLELKWVPSSRFAKFKGRVDAFGASRTVVNSFSSNVIGTFHQRYPDVRTALDTNGNVSLATAKKYGGVMPDSRHVTVSWLTDLRNAGVPVYLWTVDTTAGWAKYTGKVTLVLTNKAAAYDDWRRANCA